jgi:mono/diheme cytochrome c family protein
LHTHRLNGQPPVRTRIEPPAPAAEINHSRAATTKLAVRRSADLYTRLCQRCHGEDGAGRDGLLRLPDFTSANWHSRHSDAQLAASILEGRGARMPAFRERVSPDQAQDLVVYLRAFDPAESPRAETGGDFGQRMRELEERFHALKKEFKDLSERLNP